MMTREICKICYHPNPIGFSVPDTTWESVVPPALRNSVVCLSCFIRLGDEASIEWDKEITFFPVSFVTHTKVIK